MWRQLAVAAAVAVAVAALSTALLLKTALSAASKKKSGDISPHTELLHLIFKVLAEPLAMKMP